MTGNAKTGGRKDGWKKGEGPYSKSHPEMSRATDYTARGISKASFGEPFKASGDQGLWEPTFKPGKIKQGNSPPRFKPKVAGDVGYTKAASPTGKYASKGIGKYIVK